MFETRWRWNATRSLALLRSRGGKRVPPPLQRMRAQDLLAAVFPAQTACQDNHGGGADRDPRPPAGARDDARLPGRGDGRRGPARACSTALRDGRDRDASRASARAVGVRARDPERQPVRVPRRRAARGAAHARGGAAPRAARRGRRAASAGSTRRRSPRWSPRRSPIARDADELHDLLLDLGALPERDGRGARLARRSSTRWSTARRAARLDGAGRGPLGRGRAALARGGRLARAPLRARRRRAAGAPGAPPGPTREGALVEIVRGAPRARRADHGGGARGARSACAPSDVDAALARVEMEGGVLRGRFRPSRRGRRRRSGATGGCSRASTAARSTACAARSSRSSAADLHALPVRAGSTCGPGAQLHGRAGARARDRAAAGLRGARPAPGSARSCRRAWPATTRPGSTRSACRARWRGGGWRRATAGGTPSRAAPIALVRRARSALAAGGPTTRGRAPSDAALSRAGARRARASCATRGRQLPRRDRRRRAPPARRGRGRAVASWSPPAASPATGSRACAR